MFNQVVSNAIYLSQRTMLYSKIELNLLKEIKQLEKSHCQLKPLFHTVRQLEVFIKIEFGKKVSKINVQRMCFNGNLTPDALDNEGN